MESTICSLPAGMWLSLLGWELGEAGERVLCEIICNGLGSWEARFGSLEEQMKAVLLLNHLWLLTKRNKFSFYKVSNPSTVYPVCYYVWCGALSPCGPRKGSCKLFWKEPPASHTSVVLILSGSFIPMQYMLMWEKGKNYSLVFSDFLRLWNCIVIPESGKKDSHFMWFLRVNCTSILFETRPWPQRVQCLLQTENVSGQGHL